MANTSGSKKSTANKSKHNKQTIYYKLTDQAGYTRSGHQHQTKWAVGRTIRVKKEYLNTPIEMCSPNAVHFYADPLIAIACNEIHARILNPKMFKVTTTGEFVTDGFKCGAKSLKVIGKYKRLPVSGKQLLALAVLIISKLSDTTPVVRRWAEGWISGADRSRETADKIYSKNYSRIKAREAYVLRYIAAGRCPIDVSEHLQYYKHDADIRGKALMNAVCKLADEARDLAKTIKEI